jgi:tetratricopeptide (TPR) repeat protein/DNA-directed RNA polymerase subunit RPC12/RpoP
MDVRCARCGIEYEFDDALISDRGTMVRCTECGHQFRVHPSHVIPGAPDEWRVITPEGQTIVYVTLRELQQGITQGQVGRDANLVRGNSPARPLGTIAELDPFFPTPAAEQRQQSTLTGVAPPSLAPAEPKVGQTTGRAPIARIGLNTVQVSASGVSLDSDAAVNRPRKTTLGMGEDPQKVKEIAARAKEARDAAQAQVAIASAADKTEVTAPVAEKEVGTTRAVPVLATDTSARAVGAVTAQERLAKEAAAAKAAAQNEAIRAESMAAWAKQSTAKTEVTSAAKTLAEAAPKVAPALEEPRKPAEEPRKPAEEPRKPAEESKKPAEEPKKPVVPKQRPPVPALSTPATSEPPTLRATDSRETPAQDSVAAPRKPVSAPPRPEPRVTPTPGTRLAAVTQTAAADRAAALPLTHKTPSKPPTDPPPAQRTTRDETQFQVSAPPPPLETREPAEEPSAPSQQILPPPSEPAPDPLDESRALVFQAESPPLEHAPIPLEAHDRATPAIANEPEAGSFMPTVPPKRLLTSAEALSRRQENGARMGAWLMGGLAIVLLSLVTFWWSSRTRTTAPASAAASSGPTLEQYLGSAGDALHVGDLVRAHDQLQSSQTLGGRDPRWIVLTARYDVMRADMNWLAVRLANPNDPQHVDALKRELADHVAQASRALASIDRLAVKDPELTAARVDAQRLRGELEQARKAAQAFDQSNPSPEVAYTLANLELLGENPDYKRVFEWLGLARAADAGLGRAPAALVVACVLNQRLDCARSELARLKSSGKAHPLLPDIEAFVARAEAQAAPAASAAVAPATSVAPVPDAGAPLAANAPNAANAAASDSANNDLAGDFRVRLRRGFEALARNELTRAEQLFRSVVADRPTDTEALTGLGDVARRRNNTATAINYYQKVLSSNGQYLPALSALADVKWRSGDRAGAAPLYRRIVDQVGDSAGYGQTAAQRLRELSEGSARPSASAESDKPTAPAASAKGVGKHP